MVLSSAQTPNRLFNINLIWLEYNAWERSKKIFHDTIIMSKLLENILTEKAARNEEEIKTLAVAQNEFLAWD